ncbi:MAG: efflux RND transporter periplasmic adaptor subunit [Candidatus Peribacteraceae bacterium]|nr:efflux RND transporter periplasmic adaptor subunit [Candidatus Peribacteraceae bacterium]
MPLLRAILWPLKRVYSVFRGMWRIVRKYPKSSLAILFVFGAFTLLIWYLRLPSPPEYITETAVRGDLQQVVEGVGVVISEKDIKLQFPITGLVDKVHVQEGDRVEKGQELARLRSSGLSADVNAAAAQVASAQANLAKMVEGTRPEEIAVTEASVQNKRASLEAARETLRSAELSLQTSQSKLEILRNEAKVGLEGYVTTARSTVSQQLSTALTAAQVMDDVLSGNDLLDVFVKYEPGQLELMRKQILSAQQLIQSDVSNSTGIYEYKDAIEALDLARQHVSDLSVVLNQVYSTVSALPITPYFTNADRESAKSTIATQRTNVQSSLASLDTALKNLRDASASYDSQIATEEKNVVTAQGTRDKALADIQTYETSLRIEDAQLNLLRAGTRKSDIDAARAQLNQMYAQLQRARERYADTVIFAPISGTITKVNLKEGELLSTSFASDAAITMLGDAPYRVQVFVAEIDIPKVQVSQSGSIALDAFPGRKFDLIVSEIDPAATSVDGVSKYRVKMDFDGGQDDALKIGMTGDAEIYTDRREDVVSVPGRAVITDANGGDIVRILTQAGAVEERPVEIGMDGQGGEVEVVRGITEGEQVIVLIKE